MTTYRERRRLRKQRASLKRLQDLTALLKKGK